MIERGRQTKRQESENESETETESEGQLPPLRGGRFQRDRYHIWH